MLLNQEIQGNKNGNNTEVIGEESMTYHITGFFMGFILDILFGDPYWLPHPIRLIGKLIAGLEGTKL